MTPDAKENQAFSERMRAQFSDSGPDFDAAGGADPRGPEGAGYRLQPGGLREVFKALDSASQAGRGGAAGKR
ncbi:hypothetical protein ACUXV3_04105 [Roseobacteraceae bacterium NS-SX3]